MSKVFLNASIRDEIGSNKSNKLRKEGFVPASLFGSHMEPMSIKMSKMDVERFFADHHVGSKVFVKVDGKEVMAFAKDVQKDVFGLSILHVDLQALTRSEKFRMHVPLSFVGKENLPQHAIPQELQSSIEVEMLPDDMIETLNVDVSGLDFGHMIKVEDLPIVKDEKYKVFTALDIPLFTISEPKVIEEDEEEAEVAEPVSVMAPDVE